MDFRATFSQPELSHMASQRHRGAEQCDLACAQEESVGDILQRATSVPIFRDIGREAGQEGACASGDIGSGPGSTIRQLGDLQQDAAPSGPRVSSISKIIQPEGPSRHPANPECLHEKHHFILFNNSDAVIISILMPYLCFCSKLQP